MAGVSLQLIIDARRLVHCAETVRLPGLDWSQALATFDTLTFVRHVDAHERPELEDPGQPPFSSKTSCRVNNKLQGVFSSMRAVSIICCGSGFIRGPR